MVGVMVALPLAVRPLAAVVASPLRLRGLPGELAKQNATRNPRRTAATAAALMIGLTLVVSMGVFASSLKASFGDVLADQTNADLYVATSSAQAPGFSPAVVDAVQDVDGVDAGLGQRVGTGPLRRAGLELLGGRPDQRRGGHEPRTSRDGSIADLGKNGVVVGAGGSDGSERLEAG